MQIVREIRKIHCDTERIEIFVPKELREKQVEILVLPLENEAVVQPEPSKKKLHLTSYKCFGKKRDFSRKDAYENRF